MPAPQSVQFFCKWSPKEPLPLRAKHWLQPRPPKLGTKMETSSISSGVQSGTARYSGKGFSPLLSEKAQAVHAHIRNGRNVTPWKCRGSVVLTPGCPGTPLAGPVRMKELFHRGDGHAQHMHQTGVKLHMRSYTQEREKKMGFLGILVACDVTTSPHSASETRTSLQLPSLEQPLWQHPKEPRAGVSDTKGSKTPCRFPKALRVSAGCCTLR